MRKITARDIQVFVAVALVSTGFHALIRMAYNMTLEGNIRTTITWAMVGLLFLFGVGILLRSALALARIYLWIMVVCGGIALTADSILRLRTFRIPFAGVFAVGVLLDAILLALLLLSKSRRFADVHNA